MPRRTKEQNELNNEKKLEKTANKLKEPIPKAPHPPSSQTLPSSH